MARQRRITYAIDKESGFVYSRVGNQFAIPILDFEGMKPENNWQMNYSLEKCNAIELCGSNWSSLKWTRKIPIELKNIHRQFWGMKQLKS